MKLLIEHLRQRTIPHDLLEFFQDVPFYEGCMIVQIHDHKSTAPTQGSNRTTSGTGKTVPFSIHNYNAYLTPSSYVPYPTENTLAMKGKGLADGDSNEPSKLKDSELKDKENMPAPAIPGDGQRHKAPKKAKISTIVLRPTAISNHVDIVNKALESRSGPDSRRDSRQDGGAGGPLSATIPQTPNAAIPSTPQTSMAPPAKRLKKAKMELDSSTLYAAESQITLATTAPLVLEPVDNATQAAALLEALAHPMHSEKPPSPKTRKRTVAEMAADEALAADQERYMLVLDERLGSNLTGAQGGANSNESDGQAGGASFEPRFERFKTLENIRNQHEEAKKMEKLRQQENERRVQLERERVKLKEEAEKREQQEKLRNAQMQQQVAARQAQQREAQQRATMAALAAGQQGLQGVPPQMQGQHAHPQQSNGVMPNGMQAQPRFHQQQVSQAQLSSPIVRNGTPHSHSSPTVNNMGNIPMQQSTSSMGGSPPRPGSVVSQTQQQMSNQTAHGMSSQRSQQSHGGTPRMPSSTPQVQSTPLNRQISQTPRMSQASPLQGPMAQAPQMPMMANGQPMNLNAAQQQQQFQIQQQQMAQRRMLANQQNQAAQGLGGMMGNQQMSPQQMQFMQQQLMRPQQQQQHPGNQMQNNTQLAQSYAAQMAAMAARTTGMPPNMNQNFMNNNPGMQNMQQVQQQMQQQMQQGQQQPTTQQMQQAAFQQQVARLAHQLLQQQLPQLSQRFPNGIPDDALRTLRAQCNQHAAAQVRNNLNVRREQMAQQHAQMMAAQGGMVQNMNGMPNGMGMQRQQGM